ncbi:ABC transporter permease subunit [bacterium]|nr:ABC transporter permease subunit [bacterium]
MTAVPRHAAVARLRRARPQSRFARASGALLAALVLWTWTSGVFHISDLFSERARANAARFLGEIRPWPLHGKPWDWGVWGAWVRETFGSTAFEAIGSTVALSVAAIVLAGAAGAIFSLFAARNLAGPEPFAASPRLPSVLVRAAARTGILLVRGLLILVRAVPEYIWAFLLLTLLGVGAWPAVLALALHNAGILGRLFAEVTENMETGAPSALRAAGAGRAALVPLAIVPHNLNRWLLYLFYRWETCVREATVLGLLGFVSLGWYIQDARAGVRYDEMVGYVALGPAIILAGDFVSGRVRRAIRRG